MESHCRQIGALSCGSLGEALSGSAKGGGHYAQRRENLVCRAKNNRTGHDGFLQGPVVFRSHAFSASFSNPARFPSPSVLHGSPTRSCSVHFIPTPPSPRKLCKRLKIPRLGLEYAVLHYRKPLHVWPISFRGRFITKSQ